MVLHFTGVCVVTTRMTFNDWTLLQNLQKTLLFGKEIGIAELSIEGDLWRAKIFRSV